MVQRVSRAEVSVDGNLTGQIGAGVVVLLGITHSDTPENADWLADKIASLRIFEDTEGKMNLSLLDVGGEALVVSQFTLYGDARKGRRPSYTEAAKPSLAVPLYEKFIECLQSRGISVGCGVFGAKMEVSLVNDGPVTLIVETP